MGRATGLLVPRLKTVGEHISADRESRWWDGDGGQRPVSGPANRYFPPLGNGRENGLTTLLLNDLWMDRTLTVANIYMTAELVTAR